MFVLRPLALLKNKYFSSNFIFVKSICSIVSAKTHHNKRTVKKKLMFIATLCFTFWFTGFNGIRFHQNFLDFWIFANLLVSNYVFLLHYYIKNSSTFDSHHHTFFCFWFFLEDWTSSKSPDNHVVQFFQPTSSSEDPQNTQKMRFFSKFTALIHRIASFYNKQQIKDIKIISWHSIVPPSKKYQIARSFFWIKLAVLSFQ